MKLKQIYIKCYKSLIDQRFVVVDRCIGFVGLNESGKTNVLEAIRMLDWDHQPAQEEKSKLNDELPCVVFHFELGDKSTRKLNIVNEILTSAENIPWAQFVDADSVTISEIRVIREILEDNPKSGNIEFILDFKCKFTSEPYVVDEAAELPDNLQVNVDDDMINIKHGLILEAEKIPDEQKNFFTPLSQEHIMVSFVPLIKKALNNNIPCVVYWEYSEEYLIPSGITYDKFLEGNKPYEISRPLFNIFMIPKKLGINNEDDLSQRVATWKLDSSRRRKDAEIINEGINSYLKKIWKDNDQEFEVTLEANEITIHIRDPKSPNKNFYEMVERSQGFKTFVSFLLTIAAESHLGDITNALLVLDEPETHLHPSGVRFMRNELLKLAEQENYVFFATNSIFMIDRKKLDRHVIITKDDEHSTLKKVDRNNITQESVIYEAMGTRLDEFSIPIHNIMFEGSIDRTLFQFFLNNCLKKADNPFKDYELLDGGGTKQIQSFFKDKVIPDDSEWKLILDNDKPAIQLLDYLEKTFPDIFGNKIVVTHYSKNLDYELEDILPSALIETAFNSAKSKVLPEITVSISLTDTKPVSSQVKEFANRNSIDKEKMKSVEKTFKENVEKDVVGKLKEVNKGNSIDKKADLFKATFGKYADFIKNYIDTASNEQKHNSN